VTMTYYDSPNIYYSEMNYYILCTEINLFCNHSDIISILQFRPLEWCTKVCFVWENTSTYS